MTYETAKKLKDAGFPQKKHLDIRDYLPEPLEDGSYDKNDFVGVPTLSELIEACGSKGDRIALIQLFSGWQASGHLRGIELGKTPEEAVAELWLKLND